MSWISRHLLRSTASNVAGQAITLGTWFLLTPFILDRLGASAYGLWALVASLLAYGTLLDLGVGAAVTKYVAELRAADQSEEASALIATALRIYCATGALVAAAGVPLAFAVPALFDVSAAQAHDARWVVLLSALGLAVNLPATTAYAVLRGLQRYDLINVVGISATLTQAVATIVVLQAGWGVVGLAAIWAPLVLVWQAPLVLILRRVAPDLRFGLRGARRQMLSRVAGFSASLFVINGAGALKTKTDEIVIAGALPLAAVTPYSVARRLAELPTLITYQFVRVLMPLASHFHGLRDESRLRELYVASSRVTLALFVPVALGLCVLAGPFLTAWVGPRFAGDADIALLLVAAGAFDILMWPAMSLLQASEQHRRAAVFSGLSAVLNLGLSLVLVRRMGVTGVAVGTLVATVAEALVVMPLAMRRYAIGARELVRDVLAPTLLPALPAAATLVLLRLALEPSSLPVIVLVGAAGGLVYAAGYLCSGASAGERLALRRLAGTTLHLARR
jgi:O-antigen/teichoic acid export membrane protein